VRNEIKKKTGVALDGYGNKVETIETDGLGPPPQVMEKKNTKFKDIHSYKPTGSLIYNENLFKKIERKTR
jgi:hypothetical protein